MDFLNKLERRFGKYAISNISLMLIICYGFGYAISIVNYSFLGYLSLNPWLIIRGQVWRLFTWILIPPSSFSLFTLISLYFYYWIGTTLERTWGTFRYNVFLFSGMFFTIIGAFLIMIYYLVIDRQALMMVGGPGIFFTQAAYIFNGINTYYVNLSIFLAFALTYPDVRVLLFFIVPIKIKWLGIIDAVLTLYSFVQSSVPGKIIIAASLLNVVVFFAITRNLSAYSPKQVKRRAVYRAQTMRPKGVSRHKCAICGRTEEDGAQLEFRFCSKCNGNYEYCNDHLFTHEHRR